jgi:hypothetical protein
MRTMQHIVVFLASPSDVTPERDIACEVLEEINRTTGQQKGIHFDLRRWEMDSYPDFGGDAQAILNQQIGDMAQYDIFVGIMWNKYGSPTPRAASGTIEELTRAIDSFNQTGKPNIMFYFKSAPFSPTTANEAAQKLKVMEFRESLFPQGLIGDFTDTLDFERKFRRHIQQWLATYNIETPSPPSTQQINQLEASTDSGVAPTLGPHPQVKTSTGPVTVHDSGMWIFLNGRFFTAEGVDEAEDGAQQIHVPTGVAEDDAFFKSLRHQPPQFGEPIPFAYQNDGGLARVTSVTSSSSPSGKVWTILLHLEDMNPGFFSEININGISADEIARMRADLLLLNKLPFENNQQSHPDNLLLLASIRGASGRMKTTGSLFPQLWRQFQGHEESFLPMARLWAIFGLKASGIVEHILELKLGPCQDKMLHVRFRGRRHRKFANVDPPVIEVEGDCDLYSTSPLAE